MKNIKLKRLTQKNSAYQGQPSDPHIYEYEPFIITKGGGSWAVYSDVEVTKEIQKLFRDDGSSYDSTLWSIHLNLSQSTLHFPHPWEPEHQPWRNATLKDCKEWIAKEVSTW